MAVTLYILSWWIFFVLVGIVGIPLTTLLFRKFADSGYGLSKTAGILAVSYFIFFFSTLRILPFTRITLAFVFLLYLAGNYYLYSKNKNKVRKSVSKRLYLMIIEESLFAFGLFLWTFVRAHQPTIEGLEKLMDFGFINSLLRTRYLPPIDMWFAGKSINYYWFGHYVSALIIKATSVPSGIGYNLMLGTVLGLALSNSFSLVVSLVKNFKKKISGRKIVVAGFVSAILLNFAGNFHTPFYILKEGKDKYWYPDATRFIGYNPDVPDKTIHEFPIYSYVVSDLHAHLLNFPFVLFFLSLLYAVIIRKEKSKLKIIPILGVLLGIMFMTNAWDYANYLLVTGFVFLFYYLRRKGFNFESIYKTALPIVIMIVVSILAVLPFIVHFESIAQGVDLTHTKSPLWQLLVLWGFPALMTVVFGWRLIISKKRFVEDFFVLSILTASWILILLPELIYVKDIYAATHYRANTMFKLTYQAYVMFYLSTGYIVIRTVSSFSKLYQRLLLCLFYAAVFASVMYYPFIAVYSYYGSMKNPPQDLSGESWLQVKYPEAYNAISWFNQNVHGQPTILEAPGDSYTDHDVISSYTGLPTVSGWYVHEWLWRGSPEFPQARMNDIAQIYTSDNLYTTKSLLEKYSVKYVIVGMFEREKYPNLNEKKFVSLGEMVFTSPTLQIYKLND